MDKAKEKRNSQKSRDDTYSTITSLTPAGIIPERFSEATRAVILFLYCYNGIQKVNHA
jgi:hypothetical protein